MTSMVGLQQIQAALDSPTSFLFSLFLCDLSAEKLQILNFSKDPWHLEDENTEYTSCPRAQSSDILTLTLVLSVTMWLFKRRMKG